MYTPLKFCAEAFRYFPAGDDPLPSGNHVMTKRELIDDIRRLNPTAKPDFLARFADEELSDYLDHLHFALTEPLRPSKERLERYFRDLPCVPVEAIESVQAVESVDEADGIAASGVARPVAKAIGLEELVTRAWQSADAVATLDRPHGYTVYANDDEDALELPSAEDLQAHFEDAPALKAAAAELSGGSDEEPADEAEPAEPEAAAAEDADEPNEQQPASASAGVSETFLF